MIKNDVLNLENRLYKAIKESDVKVLEELLHENLLFVTADGKTITKEIDINTYKSGDLLVYELEPNIENLTIIDTAAVITLTMALKGSYKSQSFQANYRYIRFWKEFTDGSIKVIGGSVTEIS